MNRECVNQPRNPTVRPLDSGLTPAIPHPAIRAALGGKLSSFDHAARAAHFRYKKLDFSYERCRVQLRALPRPATSAAASSYERCRVQLRALPRPATSAAASSYESTLVPVPVALAGNIPTA